jgi:two-component system, sensor histidine kinase and response regulator
VNVLLIEDDEAIRETLRYLLELNGYTVRTASDGPEGLRLAVEAPDLILCDIGLPGMDGFEVIGEVQKLPQCRDVPFIFLTARADRSDQRKGMALGADDYITKPFTEKEILDAIQARVRRQQPLRERIGELLAQRRREVSAKWSHELLTPLAGVLGGLQLIESEAEKVKPEELREILALIRKSAERQQKLSTKLVRFFELERMAGPRKGAEVATCPADEAIEAGARRAAPEERREKDLRLSHEAAELPLSGPILADAVAELVDNAFRYSPGGGVVTVTGRRAGGRYVIEVTDQGPGMSPEQRAAVGAFTQFDRDSREQQGLGLGLAIAQASAALAGGRLELSEGPDGRGLKATMDLPVAG